MTVTNNSKNSTKIDAAIKTFVNDGNVFSLLCGFENCQAMKVNYMTMTVEFIASDLNDKSIIGDKFDTEFHKPDPRHCITAFIPEENKNSSGIWMREVIAFFDAENEWFQLTGERNKIALMKPVSLGSIYTWAIDVREIVKKYSMRTDGTVRSSEYNRRMSKDIILLDDASILFKSEYPGRIKKTIAKINKAVDEFEAEFNGILSSKNSRLSSRDKLNNVVKKANSLAGRLQHIASIDYAPAYIPD